MEILPISDIHAEFYSPNKLNSILSNLPDADVLIIAGDLAESSNVEPHLKFLSEKFPEIIYVLGNHEYYHSSYEETQNIIQNIDIDNLHILDKSTITIDGIEFAGTTLWFPEPTEPFYSQYINDYHLIEHFTDWVYKMHDRALEFVSSNNSEIMITHHAPSHKSIHEQFRSSYLNEYFVNDLTDLFDKKIWIHGHTHHPFDYQQDNTRVVCNPLGYPDECEFNPKTVKWD